MPKRNLGYDRNNIIIRSVRVCGEKVFLCLLSSTLCICNYITEIIHLHCSLQRNVSTIVYHACIVPTHRHLYVYSYVLQFYIFLYDSVSSLTIQRRTNFRYKIKNILFMEKIRYLPLNRSRNWYIYFFRLRRSTKHDCLIE